MELADIKETLQEFFTDDLVTVVGSGLSVAEGLPSMLELEEHLNKQVSLVGGAAVEKEWLPIGEALKTGVGIEQALHDNPPGDDLETLIIKLTSDLLLPRELGVIAEVAQGHRTLRFGKILRFLTPNWQRPPTIITTNYDRLIEIAAEIHGFGVDSEFIGQYIGARDPELSKYRFAKQVVRGTRGNVRIKYRNRVCVCKPHGSFDWYLSDDGPMRCSLELGLPRLIITPGVGKYRKGYDAPFDKHRERGNNAITSASRLLCIGYGFNDDHLQTHLIAKIRAGAECLVLTRSCTRALAEILDSHANMTAIYRNPTSTSDDTCVHYKGIKHCFPKTALWDLENFVDEVLGP